MHMYIAHHFKQEHTYLTHGGSVFKEEKGVRKTTSCILQLLCLESAVLLGPCRGKLDILSQLMEVVIEPPHPYDPRKKHLFLLCFLYAKEYTNFLYEQRDFKEHMPVNYLSMQQNPRVRVNPDSVQQGLESPWRQSFECACEGLDSGIGVRRHTPNVGSTFLGVGSRNLKEKELNCRFVPFCFLTGHATWPATPVAVVSCPYTVSTNQSLGCLCESFGHSNETGAQHVQIIT